MLLPAAQAHTVVFGQCIERGESGSVLCIERVCVCCYLQPRVSHVR